MAKQVDQKFFALADPARLDMVRRLAAGPLTAGQLAEPYRVSRPAISRHLRVLREAGITKAEVRGREWWYSLDSDGLQDAEGWLEDVQKMWGAALQSLKEFVEAQDGR